MNLEQFQQLLLQKQKEIEQAMRRTLPVKVGRIAKDHFQDNFRQGGFQDNGTQAWQRTHRQRTARGADSQYGPLMSSRQNLYGSIYYRPDDYRVTVGTEVPYAAIHNEGGDIVKPSPMMSFRNLAAAFRSFFVSVGRSYMTSTHIMRYSLNRSIISAIHTNSG